MIKRAGENSGEHHFVALVEIRKRAIAPQTSGVERRIVTIEIRNIVDVFAVGVVGENREVICKTFFRFENSAMVNSRADGTVNIVLQDRSRGIGKAQGRRGHARGRAPILKGVAVRWKS